VIRPASPRYAVYIAIVFLVLALVQLAGSLVFYQIIDRQTLRDDHARRVAELLVVSDRMYAIAPGRTAQSMSTRHLSATISATPRVAQLPQDEVLTDIARRIVAWEPTLAERSLNLSSLGTGEGRQDLIGSIQLADGNWLNFRSRDISTMWPVALRAIALTFAITAVCLAIGLFALHRLGRPLRQLTDAAEAIGRGREISIAENGPRDLRELAHAMNVMQERIFRLLEDQAKAFEAISHDLRTPLSRQKMIAALIEEAELADILNGSVSEMDDLLTSLQDYLRAQHLTANPERIDLNAFLSELLIPFGEKATLIASSEVIVTTFREPLALATRALVENAVQYGDVASVGIEKVAGRWTICVEDEGPGIPDHLLEAILQPFFRMDEARQRNTRGFGLGIPTAHRLMMRFGGGLTFGTGKSGGLAARLTVPSTGR